LKNKRLLYFILLIGIIFLGIMSRKINWVPLCTGDFLYAIMIYLLVRIFLVDKKAIQILILATFICYGIEFLQLYQGQCMIELRKTLFGRYVLGQGFLWSDILAYTIGTFIAFTLEKIILKRNANQESV
jgi:hypothetical protein